MAQQFEISRKGKNQILVLLVVCYSIIALDILIPLSVSSEVVTYKKAYTQSGYRGRGGHKNYGFFTDKGEYPCSRQIFRLIDEEDVIEIKKTRILNEVRRVEGESWSLENDYSIYNFYGFFPLVGGIATALALFLRYRNLRYFDSALITASFVFIYLTIAMVTNSMV